jgi:protein-disulfide isomerase
MYFHREVIDSLSPIIERGDLKVIFKDFVNPKDKPGLLAAKLANIALENDLFDEMHEFMISNTQNNDSTILTNKLIELGLSAGQIAQELNNVSILEEIQEDTDSGKQLNISGTPSYVFNGKTYIGFLSYKDIISLLK